MIADAGERWQGEAIREGLPESGHLRACLASPFFHPEYSGGAARFRRYTPGLHARGVRVDVVAAALGTWKPDRKFAGGSGTAADGPEADVDRRVHRVSLPTRGGSWQRTGLGRRVTRWQNKWMFESAIIARCSDPATRPDLLIWRYPLSLASVRALSSLRGMGIPMMRVVTMFGGPDGRGWTRTWRKASFSRPFRYLDCVVVSSDVMRAELRMHGVETRIEVIPHGVDLRRFHPHPGGPAYAGVRRRLGLGPTDKVVLFVGPLSERKGIDYVAGVWAHLAAEHERAHLVLVGPEPSGSADDANGKEMSARAALRTGRGGDRVVFVGPVSDVEEYMKGADVFLFPSRREGMPNVVLEAFATGVACVITPFEGISKDLGAPGEQYVLVDHNVPELAAAVSTLLLDEHRRQQVGGAARRWASEHLDLEASLDQLAGVCFDLAGRAPDEDL